MTEKKCWWSGTPAERFWCEITHRKDVGIDLRCPQIDLAGEPFWSYSLILDIQPGDIVFHYHTPVGAIVGASIATDIVQAGDLNWVPHWSGKASAQAKKKVVGSRPSWIRPLVQFTRLPSPLTLGEIQLSDKFVRDWIEVIKKRRLAPMTFLQMYPQELRALQSGYVTKMPAAFVQHWEKLAALDNLLSRPSVLQVPNATGAESIAADLLKQGESGSGNGGGQGFSVDPACRQAAEEYGVERAKLYFEHAGFTNIEENGKPFDLHCRQPNGEQLFVEVKGTTTVGTSVTLTTNEVTSGSRPSLSKLRSSLVAIRTWHYGKVVILWAWGLVLTGVFLIVLESVRQHYIVSSILILAMVAMPLILSVITWEWLSGKEH